MRILVIGAAGTGKTTLASEIARQYGLRHLDSDDYYWKKTNPPFQEKRPYDVRTSELWNDFLMDQKVVVSGSMVTWGKQWKHAFDFGVFLQVPQSARMERLHRREEKRYGDQLYTDERIRETSREFLEWAESYDDPNIEGQGINKQVTWLDHVTFPILNIEGDLTVNEYLQRISSYMDVTFT